MITVYSKKEELGGLHYTTSHTGKMQGMNSLSSSCVTNPLCKKRRGIEGSVCQKCFSFRQHGRLNTDFTTAFVNNGRILSERILGFNEIPHIFTNTFRFESFGDIINETHLINFVNIADKNPKTMFALWTKNFDIVKRVFDSGVEKPENLIIVASSLMVNKKIMLPEYCDKVFTVYTKDYVRRRGTKINCGENKCAICGYCYSHDTGKIINELIK